MTTGMRAKLLLGIVAAILCLAPLAWANDGTDYGSIMKTPSNQPRPGKIVWMDLLTSDVKAAAGFYEKVFGWEFEFNSDRSYALARLDGHPVAAIAAYEGEELEDGIGESLWLTSIAVMDVDDAVKRVVNSGGEVIEGPEDLAGRGRHALVSDPQGAPVILLRATGGDPEDSPETNHRWVWSELWTDDMAAAIRFYEEVIGYRSLSIKGTAGTEIHILGRDQKPRATVMISPFDDVEPNWLPYLQVADVEMAVQRVTQNGGQVLLPPQKDEVNYDVAIVADPTGGVFALQQEE